MALGLRGEILLSCKLVVENTNIWDSTGIFNLLRRMERNCFSLNLGRVDRSFWIVDIREVKGSRGCVFVLVNSVPEGLYQNILWFSCLNYGE